MRRPFGSLAPGSPAPALLAVCAVLVLTGALNAQENPQMGWSQFTSISADPNRGQIMLAHGQPRTDWILFHASCVPGPSGPRAEVYLPFATGDLPQGTPQTVEFQNNSGPALERPAIVDLSFFDFLGPRLVLAIELDDPIWAYLEAEAPTQTRAAGLEGPLLAATGNDGIADFLHDCARRDTLQPGYLGCSNEGMHVSYDGDLALRVTIFNDTLAPRQVHFVRQDGGESALGTIAPGDNAAVDARVGHTFLFRDMSGACTAMMKPEDGMSVFLLHD